MHADNVTTEKFDRATGRRQVTSNHINECRLPSAISTDDADSLSRVDRHIDIVGRNNTAKALLKVANLKYNVIACLPFSVLQTERLRARRPGGVTTIIRQKHNDQEQCRKD